jgi:hypothetical protein
MKDGKAEVVSVTDSALNDSAIFAGYVYRNYPGNEPVSNSLVWISNAGMSTVPDASGYYSIKVLPGNHSIKCEESHNRWPELIESINHYSITKNKKVVINFYLGQVSE